MVDSKSDQVYSFLKQKLDIENITKLLYNIWYEFGNFILFLLYILLFNY
jgi:hypothetical protein